MKHLYDSRIYPFLGDLLFDQLLNFDWESSRKEIEEERKRKECKKCDEKCVSVPSVFCDEELNKDLKFYSPKFELGEDGVYTYKTTVPKDLKPGELKIDAYHDSFYFGYEHKTENGSFNTASVETLPVDIDVDSMKAVLKNGVVTITAKKLEKKKEEPKDDDIEYEIEIGK